jgi:CubicO group peptidase (beta-lactamase class C family)
LPRGILIVTSLLYQSYPHTILKMIVHLSSRRSALAWICITPVLADFLGASFSPPMDLSSSKSLITTSWENITSTLHAYIASENQNDHSEAAAFIANITFSLGMFSVNDAAASTLQFHYTSPEIANAPNGTHKVDENSIYRIASLTKVFTVLAGLLGLKDTDWDLPLTDIFPSLADFAQNNPGEDNPVYMIQWDKITPSALAAQISGVTRDLFPFGPGEIILQILPALFVPGLGLPPVNVSTPQVTTPCANELLYNGAICNTTSYLASTGIQAPVFAPWTTPAYADNGFVLLGLAISAITGKTMQQLYQDSIFDPLGMSSSNSSTPPESDWYRCVIPGNPLAGFAIGTGLLVSSGGLLSTTRDLAKFGIGILNSTLLAPDQTRKWLKPVSHTARLQYSIGKPWEIIRYSHSSGHVTDIYTKLGDSGDYTSMLVLFPDYNAGFSILAASTLVTRSDVLTFIAQLVADSVIPSLEAQAALEATQSFGGTYVSTMQGLNSSLTITRDQSLASSPGLLVSSWISNGTDMLTRLADGFGPTPWRLLPSISDPKNRKEAFWLVSASDAPSAGSQSTLFSGVEKQDWLNVDSLSYGDIGVGSFVFDVGADGKATDVVLPTFGLALKREE